MGNGLSSFGKLSKYWWVQSDFWRHIKFTFYITEAV